MEEEVGATSEIVSGDIDDAPLLSTGDDDHAPSFVYESSFFGTDGSSVRKRRDSVFAGLFIAHLVCIGVLGVYIGAQSDVPSLSARVRRLGLRAGWAFGLAHLREDTWILTLAVVLASALGVAWVRALQIFTDATVYITAGLGSAGSLALAVYCLGVGYSEAGTAGFTVAGWCLLVLATVIALAASSMRRRLQLAIAVVRESGIALDEVQGVAVATVAVLIVFVIVVSFHVMLLASVFSVRGFADSAMLFWYIVFSGIWIAEVALGIYKVCISGAVAHWYFLKDPAFRASSESTSPPVAGEPALPIVRMFYIATTSSLGSIALGSLIVTALSVASWMLHQTRSLVKVRRSIDPSSRLDAIRRGATTVLSLGIGTISKLAKFVNRISYVHIAMHGFSFYVASRRVFELIARNPVDLALVEFVTRFILFAGKTFGTCAVTMLVFIILFAADRAVSGLTIAVMAVVTFVILHIFALQIEYAVTTVFVAYCEDRERTREGGTLLWPQFTSVFQKTTPGTGVGVSAFYGGGSLLEDDDGVDADLGEDGIQMPELETYDDDENFLDDSNGNTALRNV